MREIWGVAKRAVALSLGLSVLLTAPVADAQSSTRRRPPPPLVVELFTAQGCASCPQANQMLGEVAARKGIVALTYPVDYWDYLGWRDTFALPEFTARQRAYVTRLRLKEIYTPEVVIGGRREAPAVDRDKVGEMIDDEADARRTTPALGFARRGLRVTVGSGAAPRGGAELWLVRYDPVRRDVRVRSGENAGKTVTHVNVVRDLVRLGAWNGRARTYAVPTPDAGMANLKVVAILQGKDGGAILNVARN